jgi:hypothetical protein
MQNEYLSVQKRSSIYSHMSKEPGLYTYLCKSAHLHEQTRRAIYAAANNPCGSDGPRSANTCELAQSCWEGWGVPPICHE